MTTQPNCKYYFCFFSYCQSLNSRLKEFASKEQSWFKESQRLMEKIAECQKEQFEANEAYNAWLDIMGGNCGPSA